MSSSAESLLTCPNCGLRFGRPEDNRVVSLAERRAALRATADAGYMSVADYMKASAVLDSEFARAKVALEVLDQWTAPEERK